MSPFPSSEPSIDLPGPGGLVDALASRLLEATRNQPQPLLVGIHTGGYWVAEALRKRMQVNWPLGGLDISFYRDDFIQKGLNGRVKTSSLPFATEGQHLILVDDVLMSGRTIRAAMNELFDYGRPASITLVTLLDLQRRELPIQPDFCGQQLSLAVDQRIKLSGPDPLEFNLVHI